MKYIADLHIHSLFSRATSKASNLPGLAAWAAVKGIQVLGTGDFTHPQWFAQITEQLEEAEPGFFKLRRNHQSGGDYLPGDLRPQIPLSDIRFVLTAEISSIYKKNDRVRKNHNLLFAPDLESVRRLNRTLGDIGNLHSDGRPILGLDAKNLLEIVLEQAPQGFLVPAHVWTPWFSLFGSKSGFDRIEECFEELTPHIFALETGLSSDPEMNRRISALDRYTLISNSDCHSPAKLGREANIFSTGFDYFSMREALKSPMDEKGHRVFEATVEFYPEEGKYHCDGHRKCSVCFEPGETKANQGRCPVCNRPLTVGVLSRVLDLADRDRPLYNEHDPLVHSSIPLPEVLSELLGVGPATKKVAAAYAKLINLFQSEFSLLLDVPIDDIERKSTPLIGEAIRRIRENKVIRTPGYDGEFGIIKVFAEGERDKFVGQLSMFAPLVRAKKKSKKVKAARPQSPATTNAEKKTGQKLNTEQQAVVDDAAPIVVVKAGPGTGKTHALVQRVVRIIKEQDQPCTIISFTNKAADEVRERIEHTIGLCPASLQVHTFHGYCLYWLRRYNPSLQPVGPVKRYQILQTLYPDFEPRKLKQLGQEILSSSAYPAQRENYLAYLHANDCVDIDMIIPFALEILREKGEAGKDMRTHTGHLFVDEFQDINQGQYDLVCSLAQTSPVFIIGDPDQAIYGFRGADSSWFQRFIDVHQASCHQLVRNYRNSSTIMEAAEQVIGKNTDRAFIVPMQTAYKSTGRLHLQLCTTPIHEARWIIDQIEVLVGGTSHREIEQIEILEDAYFSLRDIGILFRTSKQMQVVGKAMAKHGIPFQTVDLKAFYTRSEMRPLYWAILLLAGLADKEQQLFLFGQEKGVGANMLNTVRHHLYDEKNRESSLLELNPSLVAQEKIRSRLRTFQLFFSRLEQRVRSTESLVDVIGRLASYYTLDKEGSDIERLQKMSINYPQSIRDYAQYLLRYSDSIIYDDKAECVTLSTMHAAKGLEYKVVFIAGAEQGLIPLQPREQLADAALMNHVEEERRLFYVAMTRAIDILYFTHVRSRMFYGQKMQAVEPSQFISEIPTSSFSKIKSSRPASKNKYSRNRQLSLFT
ncbi:UvrD-helicase domain-containing protein [Desulfogranum marinum]|uniref:UvrD-helicase domain-containing protein n=1 Tax=Desulfogranum marinum TaxID=453220 RepID=UPI0029C73B82|nr:UvrD-helicase domain-containing protein [Desulfogranum marinum]